jgi:hypothetical protein
MKFKLLIYFTLTLATVVLAMEKLNARQCVGPTYYGACYDGVQTQNLEGYDELREAVLLKKMNQIRTELKALEKRVTALEEERSFE